jgi:hypothetical protein
LHHSIDYYVYHYAEAFDSWYQSWWRRKGLTASIIQINIPERAYLSGIFFLACYLVKTVLLEKGIDMKTKTLIAVMAAGIGVSSMSGSDQLIYKSEGQITSKTKDWKYFVAGKKKYSYIPSEGYYANKGGKLEGPKVSVKDGAFKFFKLNFDAKTTELSYWMAFFHDKNGKMIVADIYSCIYPGAKVEPYDVVVYGRYGMASIQPLFQSTSGVEVSNLQITEITPTEAATWCDGLYKTLPTLNFTPPQDRMKLIPKTLNAMNTGKPWRVVMLGDSIVNDTFNSNFQALLKRNYPKSQLEFICSVRGSTGCCFYEDPVQFKKYVTDYKPDLLIIGGISQKGKDKSVGTVIEMAKKLGCEVMVMTGPMYEDWRKYDKAKPGIALAAQTWTPDPFGKKMQKIAQDANVEFFDMKTIWHLYLGASTKPWSWFHRDRVHANDRGKQIIGRIIARYLSK